MQVIPINIGLKYKHRSYYISYEYRRSYRVEPEFHTVRISVIINEKLDIYVEKCCTYMAGKR